MFRFNRLIARSVRPQHVKLSKKPASNHSTNDPYALPHHDAYPKEAFVFGIDPSKPYKREGWEIITAVTYVVCFVLMVGASSNTDDFTVSFTIYQMNMHLHWVV